MCAIVYTTIYKHVLIFGRKLNVKCRMTKRQLISELLSVTILTNCLI